MLGRGLRTIGVLVHGDLAGVLWATGGVKNTCQGVGFYGSRSQERDEEDDPSQTKVLPVLPAPALILRLRLSDADMFRHMEGLCDRGVLMMPLCNERWVSGNDSSQKRRCAGLNLTHMYTHECVRKKISTAFVMQA